MTRFDTAQTSFPVDEIIARMSAEQRNRVAASCERVLPMLTNETDQRNIRRLYLDLTDGAK